MYFPEGAQYFSLVQVMSIYLLSGTQSHILQAQLSQSGVAPCAVRVPPSPRLLHPAAPKAGVRSIGFHCTLLRGD